MSVKKRGERWYIDVKIQLPTGKVVRVRKASPINTKRDAERYEQDVRRAVLEGTWQAAKAEGPPTIKDFVEDFIVHSAQHNRPSTVEEKRIAFRRHIVPVLGNLRVDEVRVANVEALKKALLEKGLHPKTVNNSLAVLRRMLSYAAELEFIQHVPMIRRLPAQDSTFDFLTEDELGQVLDAVDDPQWSRFLRFVAHTGIRRGEALALRWEDICWEARKVVIRRSVTRGKMGPPKSGKPREIPLNTTALRALEEQSHKRSTYVFCQEDGTMFLDHHVRPVLRRACKRGGIRDVGIHVLRHTFGSTLVRHGASLKQVQDLLGHSDVKVTLRYSHLVEAARREAVDLLEAALGHSRGTDMKKPTVAAVG